MNILLIGNGFDLAHGLQTKYIHLLEWIKAEYALYVNLSDLGADIVTKMKDQVSVDWAIITYPSNTEVMKQEEKLQLEIWNCINNNFWIDYFLNNPMYHKENWIDFEYEISSIIRIINKDLQEVGLNSNLISSSNIFLNEYFMNSTYEMLFTPEIDRKPDISYAKLRDILLDHLNRLIRVLEIYLTEYIEKMEINLESEDILNVDFDKVLSFNYTNTYEKVYGKGNVIDYDYIHGKADKYNTIETNNMVLGIDEYLPDERKSKEVEFIAFKKYFQRIYKETGCKYREWVDEIQKNKHVSHNLYIFGHSLDETDKDVLKSLILCDGVKTHIYYLDKYVFGQQIANLVKIIGKDELIRRTAGSTKSIEFIKQKDMKKM